MNKVAKITSFMSYHRLNLLRFWTLFLLLNGLLQLPHFLSLLFRSEHVALWRTLLFLSVEWLWLVSLWAWYRPIRLLRLRSILISFYLFALIFNVYDVAITTVYDEAANLYNDLTLFQTGISGLVRNIGISVYIYVLLIAACLVVGILIAYLIRHLLKSATSLKTPSKFLLLGLCAYSLLIVYTFVLADKRAPFLAQSLTTKVGRNLHRSIITYQQRTLLRRAEAHLHHAYDYSGEPWIETPDLYIIVIESYGDALLQWDEFRPKYTNLLQELDQELVSNEWHSASIRSEAPIRGGRSWLAYTSLLFGLRINSDAHYQTLKSHFQSADYPHLINTFRTQGYHSWRLSPLTVTAQDDTILATTKKLNNYDHWLFLNDMEPFVGPRSGWSLAPPDQYSLWFLREQAERQSPDTPKFHFYITHNSHVPWVEPPTVAANWRTLNTRSTPVAEDTYRQTKDLYLANIEYQLRMLSHFVINGPDDAIYIIIGDHQPPLRAFTDYRGSGTPLHIIAKKSELITRFVDTGFINGLVPSMSQPAIFHEGFYSLFMQQWLATYAPSTAALPPLCPHGILFTSDNASDPCTIDSASHD